jgi:phosphate transport system substrate-binding protein
MGCSGLSFALVLGLANPFHAFNDRWVSAHTTEDFVTWPLPPNPLIAQRNIEDLAPYRGSVSVIYNLKDSGIDLQLSAQTLAEIFQGKITNWQQVHVRFPQEEIRVVTLRESSLSNLIFTRYLNQVTEGAVEVSWEPVWEIPFLYAKTDLEGEIAGIVDRTPGAIGYVPSVIAEYYQMSTVQIKDVDGTYRDRIN